MKKTKFRIVPGMTESNMNCWLLKDGDVTLGTFSNRQSALNRLDHFERFVSEEFSSLIRLKKQFIKK
jgi:hypothetical protein